MLPAVPGEVLVHFVPRRRPCPGAVSTAPGPKRDAQMIISGEPAGLAPALDERPADPAAQPSPPATGPPAADLPGQQRPAARRIAAALVDIVLLTALLVIMNVTVGTFTVGGGNIYFWLDGAWARVYAPLLLG